jgi:hypothetical protein
VEVRGRFRTTRFGPFVILTIKVSLIRMEPKVE